MTGPAKGKSLAELPSGQVLISEAYFDVRSRSSNSEDYLLRLIKEAAAALRLLRHKLMGTADAPEAVRDQAAIAIGALLGARAPILERIDAESAVRLVADYEQVMLWAALLEVEGDAALRAGDPAGAEALGDRARTLRVAGESARKSDDEARWTS